MTTAPRCKQCSLIETPTGLRQRTQLPHEIQNPNEAKTGRTSVGADPPSTTQLCRHGSTPVWVTQNPQAGHPTQANCLTPVITNIRTIKVPGIPAETCGESLPSPCEELTTLCAVHKVTSPGECESPGVLRCSHCSCTSQLILLYRCPESDWRVIPPYHTRLDSSWMRSVLFSSVPGRHIPDVEERIYQQVHGTAMGSAVSVVVANLVMEDIECSALSSFHTPPRFWRRYTDNTITVLVDPFHAHLNSIDPNIQFTVER